MKRLLIASIVGTIILYVYLALSHTVLNMHYGDYKYTAAQDSIIHALSSTLHEDGMYMMPYYQESTPMEEIQKDMESGVGKPWAMINYQTEMSGENGMMFLMSFIYNFISVLIICIALATASARLSGFTQHLWFVMLFALFAIFSTTMLSYNWEGNPMHHLKGSIIDNLVGYFLVGLWLAWYYGRLEKKTA